VGDGNDAEAAPAVSMLRRMRAMLIEKLKLGIQVPAVSAPGREHSLYYSREGFGGYVGDQRSRSASRSGVDGRATGKGSSKAANDFAGRRRSRPRPT